jgi:hypothetical protein
MKMLLVEPKIHSPFPPYGLLKIATHLRNEGHEVELIRQGYKHPGYTPDKIYMTSLFTYSWKPVWEAVKFYKGAFPNTPIELGGIYASLMPEHARKSGVDKVFSGLWDEVDNLVPAYDLVPEWDGSIIFTQRGCINRCGFCAVHRIEGQMRSTGPSIKPYIYPGHTKIYPYDNNITNGPEWDRVWQELKDSKLKIDIRNGIDSRTVDDKIAGQMNDLRLLRLQTSFDSIKDWDKVENGISLLKKHMTKKYNIVVLILYNFNDTPDEYFERMKVVLDWGCLCYPMRYQPLDTLKKNSYLSSKWTEKELLAARAFVTNHGIMSFTYKCKRLPETFFEAKDFNEGVMQYYNKKDQTELTVWCG